MTEWLNQIVSISDNPEVLGLFLSIILLSYLLEDLAIITAALLAADHTLSPFVALLAIFIGIASGDIGLYGLGMLAAKWRGLRYRLLKNRAMKTVRLRLRQKPLWNIAVIRFIPGLRTIGFTLSGLFKVPFIHYMTAVLIATALWTAIVFFCIYQIGSVSWLSDSRWKWVIAPCALMLLWIINRTSTRKVTSSKPKTNNIAGKGGISV